MDCTKASFETKLEAVKRVSEIQQQGGNHTKPRRSYKCQKCGKYHLTSWKKKKVNKINNKKEIIKAKRIEYLAEYWIKKKGW